ncbi:hypothetical protein D3C85_1583050 [compost metagenome]
MGEGGDLTVSPHLGRPCIPVPSNRGWGDRVNRCTVEHRPQLLDLREVILLGARRFLGDDVADVSVEDALHGAQIERRFLGFEFSPFDPGFVQVFA